MEKGNTITTSLDWEVHTISESRGGDPREWKIGKHDGNGSGWRAGHERDGRGIEYIDESDAIDSSIDGSEYGDTIPEMVDSTNDTDSSDGNFDESDGVEGGGPEGVYKWIDEFRNHWNDDRTETYRRAVREG